MALSAREIRWLFVIVGLYIGGWIFSTTELRYWWSGRYATATMLSREEYEVGRSERPVRMVALTYAFRDEETGKDREESQNLRLGTLTDYADPQVEIQYLPGVEGRSRIPSPTNRYFSVVFLVFNAVVAGIAFWGWRLMKADTWAFKPGRR